MNLSFSIVKKLLTGFFSILFLLLFFQNCGQPGEITLQSLNSEDNSKLDNGDIVATPLPGTVDFIPTPNLTINNGAKFTNSKNIMLNSETVGADEMLISNSPDCNSKEKWIKFSNNTPWVLSGANNKISVYAKFRKINGPESTCIQASITHDDLAPTVQVIQPAPKYTNLNSVEIGFVAQDLSGSGISKIYCKSSNNLEFECKDNVEFNSLSESSYSLSIRTIDKAGNISVPVVDSFVVDRTSPVIKLNGPSGILYNKNPKYNFSIVENNLQSVSCRLSPLESKFKDCSNLIAEYSNLTSGSYNFEVLAVDLAGNKSLASLSYENDLSVPSVTITKSPLAIGNSTLATFEFTGTSGVKTISKFMCSLNGSIPSNCTSPISFTGLSDKEYLFSVYGINEVSTASSPQTYKFIVDTTPPQLSIVSAPTGNIKSNSVTIVLNATDLNGVKNIKCSLNGAVSDCSNKTITYSNLPDQNASYYFIATAVDNAGNSVTTNPIDWVIDNTPESKILANMEQNPIPENSAGTLNISLTQVTNASYKCIKLSNNSTVSSNTITNNESKVTFNVTEDTQCDVVGLDKLNQPLKASVLAEVSCGNKIKENGKCVDFKCTSTTQISYSKNLVIPARSGDGICYAMKIFNSIANGKSNLTTAIDYDVVSRNHDSGGGTRNPYSMGSDLLNFKLNGPRVVKLSGGANSSSPILIDNFALIGLYPKGISPVPAHYSAHGTADSTTSSNEQTIEFQKTPVYLKSFGPSGTATVAPLEIVKFADINLDYMLDIRALDCGGSRELSDVWLLFQ